MKVVLLTIALALGSICYSARRVPHTFRAHIPLPVDYVSRLRMLEGWPVEQGDGLNCSGFVSNAHSAGFRRAQDIYQNARQDLVLIDEVENVARINEHYLVPGDLAAFEGPEYNAIKGVHVAAYLGNGEWIDADYRNLFVRKFRMRDKDAQDKFFAGRVRLYQWRTPEAFSLLAPYRTLGKDDSQ